jgi:hypothetical protein
MGVGDLNEPKKGVPTPISKKILEMDVLIAKTFCTQAGKKVLSWLREQYVENPVEGYVVDRNGNINADATTFQMYQREGQKIVVKNLEMRMKRANKS